jgi:hypothetical protein
MRMMIVSVWFGRTTVYRLELVMLIHFYIRFESKRASRKEEICVNSTDSEGKQGESKSQAAARVGGPRGCHPLR